MNAPAHVLRSAVALNDARLVYVPVPKAACTAILWSLAGAAGLTEKDFLDSRKLEDTRALTVHDLSVWGSDLTLARRSQKELDVVLCSPDWLRVSVVREPLRRLWSAWASKLLVRSPRFVAMFGDEAWFPRPPSSSQEVLQSFRRFIAVLDERPAEWHDPHWAPQAGLLGVGEVTYGHIGGFESLDASMAVLRARLREHGRAMAPLRPGNASLVPYEAGVFDTEAYERAIRFTAGDRETFGYEQPARASVDPGAAWHAGVTASLPAIRAVVERNERITDLRRLLRDTD